MATIKVGLSGWSYSEWRGDFYPDGLPAKQRLRYAAEHFPTLEINASFYSLKRPSTYAGWHEEAPAVTFAVKGSKLVTHVRRLADVEQELANFFASGVLALGPGLGPSCGSSRRACASTPNGSRTSSTCSHGRPGSWRDWRLDTTNTSLRQGHSYRRR
ncbi:hypothetical protein GCM10025862_33480 [Arsenicicoccus piscis]|uniref:DUF72 domain-containing protein n=1 Tax=Arsenicicoccus piscis TaxID=673954 RepID=A0ABQ6HSI7_9MICO|nr:hypothetical protein GCM10025862_33480 [Arsenicicoccus piscis]